MSAVYNPESDLIAEIERIELTARDIRRKIEYARSPDDRRVLNRLLKEAQEQIEFIKNRLL